MAATLCLLLATLLLAGSARAAPRALRADPAEAVEAADGAPSDPLTEYEGGMSSETEEHAATLESVLPHPVGAILDEQPNKRVDQAAANEERADAGRNNDQVDLAKADQHNLNRESLLSLRRSVSRVDGTAAARSLFPRHVARAGPLLVGLHYGGPMLVMAPIAYGAYPETFPGSDNSVENENVASFKQVPSLPFQIPWPLAPYFPVLIKDPFLAILHGGGWDNIIEYGQSADVCNLRHMRSSAPDESETDEFASTTPVRRSVSPRRGRALARRALPDTPSPGNVVYPYVKKSKKVGKIKNKRRKPSASEAEDSGERQPNTGDVAVDTDRRKGSAADGDLRTPFGGGFDWFGNKKPVAPSPGFFINRMKVRRGGVAIAGPGGVATAGRGGTAIVGPGGLAYTQPGGLAVAGPDAKVLALSGDADLDALVARLRARLFAADNSSKLTVADPEARLVATGPVIYYHPNDTPARATPI